MNPDGEDKTQTREFRHTSVMLREVLEYLQPREGDAILDCTVGGAGHSAALLGKIGKSGMLVGVDQDEEALVHARGRLEKVAGNFQLFYSNFENIDALPGVCGVRAFDGILFDLGVSSYQFDNPDRGFSFQKEGGLDMRMDTAAGLTAGHIINRYSEDDLMHIFRKFGEEHEAPRIVRRIVEERRKAPIESTVRLAEIIRRAKKPQYRYQRIHPATKVFQALRIAVNRELEVLETGLNKSVGLMKTGARLCVISFHSLEDRIVKHFFKNNAELEPVTKKPLTPLPDELDENPRSRSAKMRVAQKVGA